MEDHVDPNSSHSYGLDLMTTALPMEKFGGAGTAGSGLEGQFSADFDFGNSMSDFFNDTPCIPDPSHTAHDDSCITTCAVGNNLNGIHRGSYITSAAYARPTRLATAPVPAPFSYVQAGNDVFGMPSQHYDAVYSPYIGSDSSMNVQWEPEWFQNSKPQGTGSAHFAGNMGMAVANDDCTSVNCSQACSDFCCSVDACEDEACEEAGTPCNDIHCIENLDNSAPPQPLDPLWHLEHDWDPPILMESDLPLHDQPCNHTSAEHLVAKTLRDLGAPGVPLQPVQDDLAAFDGPSVFDSIDYTSENSPALHSALETPPLTSYTPLSSPDSTRPNISTQGSKGANAQHCCQWVVSGNDIGNSHTCDKVFATSSELQDHLCADHIASMSSKTKYRCLWKSCSRRMKNGEDCQNFASRNKLRRHISTHTSFKPFVCATCGEGFSAQQALDQHIRTHTGEKPYTCDVEGCGKSFKQKSALTMHKRTHTGEKPLECEICGKKFCESSNLSKHRKTHNPDYKFKCAEPGCDKQFIRVDQLRRHMEKHVRQRKKNLARMGLASSASSGLKEEMA